MLALLTASVSFIILIGLTPVVPSRAVTLILIGINSVWVLGLVIIVFYEMVPIIRAWRSRRAGSRLHVRLISLFALVATMPAVAVALVSGPALNLGLDRWFDTTTRQIVGSSIDLANAYADEMLQNLKNLSYAMAFALDNKKLLERNPAEYKMQLTRHAIGRNLRGAFLLSASGTIFISSNLGDEDKLPIPPSHLIELATSARPFSFQPGIHDYFGIILKFTNIPNTFLYLVRDVDKEVLSALRLTEVNTDRYRDLNEKPPANTNRIWYALSVPFLVYSYLAIWAGIASC